MQGRLFRATKKLLARKEELSFPNYHDKTTLANDINDFVVRKITRIRVDIDANDVESCIRDATPTDSNLEDVYTCSSKCPLPSN